MAIEDDLRRIQTKSEILRAISDTPDSVRGLLVIEQADKSIKTFGLGDTKLWEALGFAQWTITKLTARAVRRTLDDGD